MFQTWMIIAHVCMLSTGLWPHRLKSKGNGKSGQQASEALIHCWRGGKGGEQGEEGPQSFWGCTAPKNLRKLILNL